MNVLAPMSHLQCLVWCLLKSLSHSCFAIAFKQSNIVLIIVELDDLVSLFTMIGTAELDLV